MSAFLGEGSGVTLMEKSIFDKRGLEGESDPLCLKWTGDTTRLENDSLKTTLTISNMSNSKKFELNSVHTVDNLALPTQSTERTKTCIRYPYPKNLPIKSYQNATLTILIGADILN